MTALAWDEVGERRYEAGVDRGVLYLPAGGAVPWNGLVSVSDNSNRQMNFYYLDGMMYLSQQIVGAYSAKLKAFTYPDDLELLAGLGEPSTGTRLHDQRARPFHLSYRTKIGNDVGPDHGYKIHVIYNVLAIPSGAVLETVSDSIAPTPFEWDLIGTPMRVTGFRPTSHISFDSRRISEAALGAIEGQLYGDGDSDASLPSLEDLLALAAT